MAIMTSLFVSAWLLSYCVISGEELQVNTPNDQSVWSCSETSSECTIIIDNDPCVGVDCTSIEYNCPSSNKKTCVMCEIQCVGDQTCENAIIFTHDCANVHITATGSRSLKNANIFGPVKGNFHMTVHAGSYSLLDAIVNLSTTNNALIEILDDSADAATFGTSIDGSTMHGNLNVRCETACDGLSVTCPSETTTTSSNCLVESLATEKLIATTVVNNSTDVDAPDDKDNGSGSKDDVDRSDAIAFLAVVAIVTVIVIGVCFGFGSYMVKRYFENKMQEFEMLTQAARAQNYQTHQMRPPQTTAPSSEMARMAGRIENTRRGTSRGGYENRPSQSYSDQPVQVAQTTEPATENREDDQSDDDDNVMYTNS